MALAHLGLLLLYFESLHLLFKFVNAKPKTQINLKPYDRALEVLIC